MRGSDRQCVHVIGGLGNQLFQYLFGEVIAERSNRETVYDTSGFANYRLHEGLAIARTFEVELKEDQGVRPSSVLSRHTLLQKLARRSALLARLLGVQTDLTFILGSNPLNPGYYLGYWQSQPYQAEEIARVVKALRFRPEIEMKAAEVLERLDCPLDRVAAVHVRRGDFITARPPAPHYALPLDYYVEAMQLLQRERGVEHFVVASDEPEWVDRFLCSRFPVTNLSKGSDLPASYDLCTLAHLPHKVLSNSTFGWWAAMIGSGEGLVIAPRQWCRKGSNADIHTPSIPSTWRLLDVSQ